VLKVGLVLLVSKSKRAPDDDGERWRSEEMECVSEPVYFEVEANFSEDLRQTLHINLK
jgi:hypothetical protein